MWLLLLFATYTWSERGYLQYPLGQTDNNSNNNDEDSAKISVDNFSYFSPIKNGFSLQFFMALPCRPGRSQLYA